MNHISYLFQQYFDGKATAAERDQLFGIISAGRQDEALKQLLETELQQYSPGNPLDQLTADTMFNQILHTATAKPAREIPISRRKNRWMYFAAAAAAVLIIIAANFWLLKKPENVSTEPSQVARTTNTPAPVAGGNKAILVLADGRRVVLDSAEDGTIAVEGNTTITRNGEGEISYQHKGANPSSIQFNTLSTPLGGQYKIRLPDGSKVWLNAASTIRYPTAFTGTKREVTITGEAYFEVVKNETMPFVVNSPNVNVLVLGTNFNVNSYADEPVTRTTLAEGSVRVSSTGSNSVAEILKPGEQAQLLTNTTTPAMQVRNVDVESVLAWKNGYFHFDGTPAQEVMRQIARWYDADIECDSKLTRHFRGMIARSASMEEVFHMLSITGEFRYSIKGRKVTVTP